MKRKKGQVDIGIFAPKMNEEGHPRGTSQKLGKVTPLAYRGIFLKKNDPLFNLSQIQPGFWGAPRGSPQSRSPKTPGTMVTGMLTPKEEIFFYGDEKKGTCKGGVPQKKKNIKNQDEPGKWFSPKGPPPEWQTREEIPRGAPPGIFLLIWGRVSKGKFGGSFPPWWENEMKRRGCSGRNRALPRGYMPFLEEDHPPRCPTKRDHFFFFWRNRPCTKRFNAFFPKKGQPTRPQEKHQGNKTARLKKNPGTEEPKRKKKPAPGKISFSQRANYFPKISPKKKT